MGPKGAAEILFFGFYDVSQKAGYLTRTRLSKRLDAEFFGVLESCVRNHAVQDYQLIPVLDFRPPGFIHRWCDRERFSRIATSYSDKALGVVWGTVDDEGITSLQVRLNSRRYKRNPKADEQINRSVRVLNSSKLLPEQRAIYLARVLAAIWSQSFCNDIAYGGDWQAAQRVASESRRMVETALQEVAAKPRLKRALMLLSGCYCQTPIVPE